MTYDTGSSTDLQDRGVRSGAVGERGVESSLSGHVGRQIIIPDQLYQSCSIADPSQQGGGKRTGRSRLVTLKLSRQALI